MAKKISANRKLDAFGVNHLPLYNCGPKFRSRQQPVRCSLRSVLVLLGQFTAGREAQPRLGHSEIYAGPAREFWTRRPEAHPNKEEVIRSNQNK